MEGQQEGRGRKQREKERYTLNKEGRVMMTDRQRDRQMTWYRQPYTYIPYPCIPIVRMYVCFCRCPVCYPCILTRTWHIFLSFMVR